MWQILSHRDCVYRQNFGTITNSYWKQCFKFKLLTSTFSMLFTHTLFHVSGYSICLFVSGFYPDKSSTRCNLTYTVSDPLALHPCIFTFNQVWFVPFVKANFFSFICSDNLVVTHDMKALMVSGREINAWTLIIMWVWLLASIIQLKRSQEHTFFFAQNIVYHRIAQKVCILCPVHALWCWWNFQMFVHL